MNLYGRPIEYIIVFFYGVLLSFSPCVYPLIPVSVGYIGIRSGGSRLRGLALSLIYVTGVAVTYSILGLLASLTGKMFGAISVMPVTRIFVGIIIVLFGISMLDIFRLPLPSLIRLPSGERRGYFSTLILGLASGLMVSPCITPALGSILLYLASKKNILYGATILFSFAYGMGFLLIVLGTFSTTLVSLPKSGEWLLYIKKACAFIVIAMGIYFILNAIVRI